MGGGDSFSTVFSCSTGFIGFSCTTGLTGFCSIVDGDGKRVFLATSFSPSILRIILSTGGVVVTRLAGPETGLTGLAGSETGGLVSAGLAGSATGLTSFGSCVTGFLGVVVGDGGDGGPNIPGITSFPTLCTLSLLPSSPSLPF